jgi:uncharacterized protein YlxP (DUF503 family)
MPTCTAGPEIGVATVASTHQHVVEVLERCERLVAARPDVEVLVARRGCSTTTISSERLRQEPDQQRE